MTFGRQLILTVIDKAVIGGLLALAAYASSRLLEAFKADQSRELEASKLTQSEKLESFKAEENRKLEAFKSILVSEGEANRNLRLAVAEVAKRVAAGIHTICWVAWIAKFSPQEFRAEHFDS